MKGLSIKQEEKLKKAVKYYLDNNITVIDCSLKFKCSRHSLSKWIKRSNGHIKKHNKQFINSNIFNIINTEEKAYWLGFLYADGYVSSNKNKPIISLELALKDKLHLEKFRLFLNKELKNRNDHLRTRCIFQDEKIYNDLNKLGCIARKSLILKFPVINQVPDKFIKHFIRGYLDGDGSIFIIKAQKINWKPNIGVSILGTKEFLIELIDKLNLPKRKLYKNNKENDSNCYFFEYSGINCLNFLKIIYTDANIFLERKYNKYLEYCRLREEIPQIITAELSKKGVNPNLN